jgi:hypothetical protein
MAIHSLNLKCLVAKLSIKLSIICSKQKKFEIEVPEVLSSKFIGPSIPLCKFK